MLVRDPAAELVYPSSVCSKPMRMYIYQVAYQNVAANILNQLISYKLKKWERASTTITSQTRIAIVSSTML